MSIKPGLYTVGKLGNRIYYERNGKVISRPYKKPVHPRTPAQLAMWAKFAAGVALWQALPPKDKKAWDKIGDMFNYEGFNRFMSRHMLS